MAITIGIGASRRPRALQRVPDHAPCNPRTHVRVTEAARMERTIFQNGPNSANTAGAVRPRRLRPLVGTRSRVCHCNKGWRYDPLQIRRDASGLAGYPNGQIPI